MVKCPNPDCGYENVDGTQFCEGCGEELPQGSGAATAAAAPAADGDLIKCPACENLNPSDNVVCEVCGTDLQANAPAAPAADTLTASTPATTVFDTLADSAASTIASAAQADLSADSSLATAPDAAADTAAFDTLDTQLDAPAAPTADDSTAIPDAGAPAAGGSLEPGQVKLVVEQGMTVGKQFVLGDPEVLVGREDEDEQIYPDIDLSDQDEGYVHRRHATLKFDGGNLTVEHLGGANKTRLNNRPLPDNEANPVKIGDKIAFGKVVMRVQAN